ncbi:MULTISPECIES: helix-turn-helix domain-containing protein [unclassified Enterococcus]|uniref:helix-turn-helix domain-containing protein n=1 Tax=unclassified Enterococcus TaxID=2608891 RepID=UPI001A93189F|nr:MULTISPECIES: helix-turn-helix domain-containing protein [unclassified Enterococcus]MBO0460741.1 helix-turn-helix domain-containing protein [Enterococcus sp. DIV1298c]MBO1299058.1 helix-turn-helix domain-containing protein [Enterococcus sp. DIV1271a]
MEYIMDTFSSHYLTKKQSEMLKLFTVLVTEKYLSLNKLSVELNLTMYQTKILLVELEENFEQLDFTFSSFFLLEKGTIGLIEGFNQEVLLQVFVNLKKKFFNESPYFQLLLYLLKHRKTRVVDISDKLMFSKSYCYKLISRLKDIFQKQKIPITIHSNFESISLEGNEKSIRTYHYLVQVMAYNVFADSQTRVNIDLVGDGYGSLKTTKVKHDILFSILENAVSRGYLVQDLEKEALEIFDNMKELYEDDSLTKLIPTRNIEDREKEIAFFYFCRQLLIPETTSKRDKIFLGEKFKRISSNEIVDFSIDVVETLSNKYNIKPEVENVILYESVINSWAYKNIYFENLKGMANQHSPDSRIQEVKNLVLKIVENRDLKVGDRQIFANKLAYILSYYLPIQNSETVIIAISMLHHPEYVPVIQNKLLTIFNRKIINFTSTIEGADVLVSDGILFHEESQDFAFFRDIHNKNHWDNLNTVVQARIIAKLG